MANEIIPLGTLTAVLAGRVRAIAVKLATEGLDDACTPVRIPSIPYGCVEVNAPWLKEMRSKGHDDNNGMVAAYTAYEVQKAGAIAENESRLRGLLWCYRALRSEYENDKADTELAFLGKKVRAFISKHWGIDDPPMDRVECNTVAMQIVATRVPQ